MKIWNPSKKENTLAPPALQRKLFVGRIIRAGSVGDTAGDMAGGKNKTIYS
jgi:hypothetical protein